MGRENMEREKTKLKRYPLDNSALFYPIMATKKAQSLFRITLTLSDQVDGALLEEGLNKALLRFPTYKTRLKKGYAWHYLEENPERAKVFEGEGKLLAPINPDETNGYLFRFVYEGRKLYLEIFHGLCDGVGAVTFFKGVLQQYRTLQGVAFEDDDTLVDFDTEPTEDEIEDAFKHYYEPIKFSEIQLKELTGQSPQLIKGTLSKDGYKDTVFKAMYSDVNKIAKGMGVSFTAFTAGLVGKTLEDMNYGSKPVVVMVPVNLRTVFPSKNVRNFVTFVRLVFKRGEHNSLEEYVLSASRQLKEKTEKKKLNGMLATTVRTEKTGLLRVAPLWLKIAVAKSLRRLMKSRQTIIVSNIGKFDVPHKMGVESAVLNMNVSKNAKINLGILSVNGEVSFTFTRSIDEDKCPKAFQHTLKTLGVEMIN